MNLGRLYLRHSSRFFLFFDEGSRLFSCKWVRNNSSCGHYEFHESVLGRSISSIRRDDVEWDEYENFLSRWLDSNGGLVFEKSKVFDLAWLFFVRRNDRFLSSKMNPVAVYSTVDASNKFRAAEALEMIERISTINTDVYGFWNSKVGEIISKYAYWLDGFKTS